MTRNTLLKTALAILVGAAAGCGPQQATNDIAQVTFDITVPASTPAGGNVYVIGSHPNLGNNSNDAGLKLRRDSDTKFRGSVYLPKGQSFLYRIRLKDPTAAELNAKGEAVAPRDLIVGDQDFTQTVSVMQWDVPVDIPKPEVTFVVTVPSNTPANAEVYMAGNQPEIGPWNPSFHKLTKGSDGKYRTTIKFAANPGTGVEYKFTRGAWEQVEKAANGDELANRTLTIPNANTTVEATIARWADLGAP